jgi:hypothetical protein
MIAWFMTPRFVTVTQQFAEHLHGLFLPVFRQISGRGSLAPLLSEDKILEDKILEVEILMACLICLNRLAQDVYVIIFASTYESSGEIHLVKHRVMQYWLRWAGWLVAVAALIVEPATSRAAILQPERFAPSIYMPLLNSDYCTGQRSQEVPFGTQVYGRAGYNTEYFHLLQESNSAWLRNSVEWLSVEPVNVAPAQYQWAEVDRILSAVKENCSNMIITIGGTPRRARLDGSIDGRTPFKPEYLSEFTDFVTALVERYDGDGINDAPSGVVIQYWELYNEPDFGSAIARHEGWGEHAERYAQMLAAIYEPIHEHNPLAQVVFGGLAYSNFGDDQNQGMHVRHFFEDVLAAGGGAYFDVMNFHYYPFQHNRIDWTDTNTSGLVEKYASLHETMATYNVEKPFMITELGYHCESYEPQSPSNPEYQARFVLELFTQSMSLGSHATIWWAFVDGHSNFPYRTGLITKGKEWAARPSYVVYQQAINRLGRSEFVEITVKPTAENDLEAYRFLDKSGNQTYYVAWLNPVAPVDLNSLPDFQDGDTQAFQVPGTKATIISKEGSTVGTIQDSDDGNTDAFVTVSVGRDPIYIVME